MCIALVPPLSNRVTSRSPSIWTCADCCDLVAFRGFDRVVACLVRDPIDFPGLASIVRVGLFEMRRIPGHLRSYKSNIDGPALPWFLIVKLAATILELADHGLYG